MKRVLILMLGVAMMFAVSGSALADFEAGKLNVALWNTGTEQEVLYDLGVIGTDFGLSDGQVLLDTADLGLGEFSNINVWASEATPGAFDPIFGTKGTTDPGTSGFSGFNGFKSGADNIAATFSEGTLHKTTDANSFVDRLGANGSYAGFNLSGPDGIIPIEPLLATQGFVDVFLYYYVADLTAGFVPQLGDGGEPYRAVLRLESDGDLILNPVPVPAAVWLLGSGLLALVGIRRKKS